MDQPLLLHKPVGLTPYQAIKLLKQQSPDLASHKISAAGRLDPMAEGLLVLLVGQLNKQQTHYLTYSKTYRTVLIFGLDTDSYDLLGLPNPTQRVTPPKLEPLDQVLSQHTGLISQDYPPYSAVQVNGHPLHFWAHHQLLHSVNIPKKDRYIMSIEKVDTMYLSKYSLLQYINHVLPNIDGQYRQQPIIKAWHSLLTSPQAPPRFTCLELDIVCSSGTFIRSLAHSIGQALDCPAITLTINRTSVGPHHLDQALRLKPASLYQTSPFFER